MPPDAAPDVTALLRRMAAGDAAAGAELLPHVHAELHRLARRAMDAQDPGHTLQPTALLHEAWLRLAGQSFDGREHFLAVAARAMRSVLVDHARRKAARKRDGGGARVALDEGLLLRTADDLDLLALDEALERLGALDPQLVRIVELLFFAGCDAAAAARVLGCSSRTVERGWRTARAWLHRSLAADDRGDEA